MWWVLIRTASMRRFFWAPQKHVLNSAICTTDYSKWTFWSQVLRVNEIGLYFIFTHYGRCSKIFNTIVECQKGQYKQGRPRSDCFWRSSLIRVFPVGYSDKQFVSSSPDYKHVIWEHKMKLFEILEPVRNYYNILATPMIYRKTYSFFLLQMRSVPELTDSCSTPSNSSPERKMLPITTPEAITQSARKLSISSWTASGN